MYSSDGTTWALQVFSNKARRASRGYRARNETTRKKRKRNRGRERATQRSAGSPTMVSGTQRIRSPTYSCGSKPRTGLHTCARLTPTSFLVCFFVLLRVGGVVFHGEIGGAAAGEESEGGERRVGREKPSCGGGDVIAVNAQLLHKIACTGGDGGTGRGSYLS